MQSQSFQRSSIYFYQENADGMSEIERVVLLACIYTVGPLFGLTQHVIFSTVDMYTYTNT